MLADAYACVRAAPMGPADDPLVHIRPEDIEETIIARGGWKGLGDLEIRGAGWGLVKFIWRLPEEDASRRHGQASAKPAAKQVSRDDILAFPQVIRDYESFERPGYPGTRNWVVERADGQQVLYADQRFAEDQQRRVVTIHVLDDDKRLPLSRPRAAGAPDGGRHPRGAVCDDRRPYGPCAAAPPPPGLATTCSFAYAPTTKANRPGRLRPARSLTMVLSTIVARSGGMVRSRFIDRRRRAPAA